MLTQALYQARELAMARMEEEAHELGADGVIGVRLKINRHAWGEALVEFVAIGTAVYARERAGQSWRAPSGMPFTSDLSGQDFWMLLKSGYRPVSLVMGNCVYHVAHQTLGELVLDASGRTARCRTSRRRSTTRASSRWSACSTRRSSTARRASSAPRSTSTTPRRWDSHVHRVLRDRHERAVHIDDARAAARAAARHDGERVRRWPFTQRSRRSTSCSSSRRSASSRSSSSWARATSTSAGSERRSWTANMELGDISRMMHTARHVAMRRLTRAGPTPCGADGVVGDAPRDGARGSPRRVHRDRHRGEAPRRATARRGAIDTAAPFTCDLSGVGFLGARARGLPPGALAHGVCVYHVAHQTLGQWFSSRSGSRTWSMPAFTQALYDARELAMGRMQYEAHERGRDGGRRRGRASTRRATAGTRTSSSCWRSAPASLRSWTRRTRRTMMRVW